ncbi:MAG: hypothetical protein F2801_08960 [Actinobacteria bacterium]|nr:hypothetical protein [Actinomycetota bacterium]
MTELERRSGRTLQRRPGNALLRQNAVRERLTYSVGVVECVFEPRPPTAAALMCAP